MKKQWKILPISLFVQGSIDFVVFLQNQNPKTPVQITMSKESKMISESSRFIPKMGLLWTFVNFLELGCFQRRQWHPTPVLLPGESHGWRSLVGCSPWGCYESDMTERLHFQFSLSCIGEGNGNPLQCSCLENPRDRGAWWAAVYGVTQSQTRLK